MRRDPSCGQFIHRVSAWKREIPVRCSGAPFNIGDVMRPPGSIRALCILLCLTGTISSQHYEYIWKQEVPPGNGSFEENWTPGKFPMGIIPLIAFDNKLFMVGKEKTWISEDGIHWTARAKTPWGERYGMSITFFNNKLWAMGGMKTWDKFYHDIWVSEDGFLWRLITSEAEWSERRGHSVVVFNNKMWLLGGSVSTGKPNKPPTQLLSEVWSSQDGIHWSLVTNNAAWSGREPRAIAFHEKLVLIGDINSSDVWTSMNGKDWLLLNNKCPWPDRQNYGLLSFENNLWIFGGRGLNDVWNSPDGKTWAKQSPAPWATRTAEQSIVFQDKIWIYGGKTGREDSWEGDVWTMKKQR